MSIENKYNKIITPAESKEQITIDEYKQYIQTAMTALELAVEDLKISNIDLEILDKKGESKEWIAAKLHDSLMSYYLYKAEELLSKGK